MAPPSLDGILTAISAFGPDHPTPTLPPTAILPFLAALLALDPSASPSPPSTAPAASSSSRTPTTTTSRASSRSKAPPSPVYPDSLPKNEAVKFGMRVVNASLSSLSGFVQSGWRVTSAPSSSCPPSSSSSTRATPSTFKTPVRKPVYTPTTLPTKRVAASDSAVTSSNPSPAPRVQVEALLECAILALRRVLAGPNTTSDVVLGKACVSMLMKSNALGLFQTSFVIVEVFQPTILALYEHAPLPSPSRAIKHTPTTTPKSTATTASKRTVPSSSTKTPSAQSAPLNDWKSETRVISFPKNEGETKDEAKEGVVGSWACASLIGILGYLSPKQGGLEALLIHIQSPLSPNSQISTSTPPSSLLPLLKLLFSPPNPHPSTQPETSLHLRTISLELMACCLPGVKQSTVWDQTLRAVQIYLREKEEREGWLGALGELRALVDRLKGRWGPDGFGGREWERLVEVWGKIAAKVDDLESLNYLTSLLGPTGDSVDTLGMQNLSLIENASVGIEQTKEGETDGAIIVRVSAELMKGSVVLDRLVKSGHSPAGDSQPPTPTLSHSPPLDLIHLTRSIPELFGALSRDLTLESLEKVFWSIEKFRRLCTSLIQQASSGSQGDLARVLAIKILEGVETLVQHASPSFTEHERGSVDEAEGDGGKRGGKLKVVVDCIVSSVDTLILLSRVHFSLSDPTTHDDSLRLLTRAVDLRNTLDAFSTTSSHPTVNVPSESANVSKCIGGIAYHCAGQLYSAGMVAQAAELMELCCNVYEDALRTVGGLESLAKEEAWSAMRDGMVRKWELLGGCWKKQGDLQKAYRAYICAIQSLPSTFLSDLSTSSATKPTNDFFSASSSTANSNLVIRTTLLAVWELQLSPEHVSLVRLMAGKVKDDVRGALGEWQLNMMRERLESAETGKVVGQLVDDLLEVYHKDKYPVRRSRVLAIAAQMACYLPQGRNSKTLTEEIQDLSRLGDLGLDSKLASYLPQYQACSHIWSSIYAYCNRAGDETILHHASAVVKLLKSMLPIVDAQTETKPVPALAESARQPRTRQASANAVLKKKTVASPPKKSPATTTRSRVVSRSQTTAKTTATKEASRTVVQFGPFDQLELLVSYLEMSSSLLGLLGHTLTKIQHLKIIQQLTKADGSHLDAFVAASGYLGAAYVKIGKTSRARTVFFSTITAMSTHESVMVLSPSVKVDFLLRYAQFLISEGDEKECVLTYEKALKHSSMIVEETSGTARIRGKSLKLERAAIALMVAAAVQKSKNDFAAAASSLAQSHRLWTRAADNITRISFQLPATALSVENITNDDPANPFQVSTPAIPANPANQPSADSRVDVAKPAASSRRQIGGLSWRISEGLLECLFYFSTATIQRGTSRDTECLLQQAQDYALAVDSKGLANRALIKRATVQLYVGQIEKSRLMIDEAQLESMTACGTDLAEYAYLEGRLRELEELPEDALAAYDSGLEALRIGENTFNEENPASISGRSSLSKKEEPLHASLVGLLLRQKIVTLRTMPSYDSALVRQLESQLNQLPSNTQTQYDRFSYHAKVAFLDALEDFKNDLALCSLTESSISMPMGTSTGGSTVHAKIRKAADLVLSKAEIAYEKLLSKNGAHALVQQTRDACLSLSLLRAYKTSLGQDPHELTVKTAWLLDHGSAITLRHELLEAVQSKFKAPRDDLVWPTFASRPSRPSQVEPNEDILDDEDRPFWTGVVQRHQVGTLYELDAAIPMPANWSVVSITVTEDLTKLFVTRHRTGHAPLVFSLPLDRHGRRDDGEEDFSFTDAIDELQNIIARCEETGKSAKDVDGKEGRAAWWTERRDLDKRMAELLGNVEFCWLGAFKSIFNPPGRHTSEALAVFKNGLERVFTGSMLTAANKKKASKIHIDDDLLLCFATLPSTSRDEELEDLLYFILDLYQVHGVEVAVAELDVDEMVLKIRELLEGLEHPKSLTDLNPSSPPHHTFLILDRHVQPLPWESIKVLRGRSVSRVPSMAFIQDRLALRQRRFEEDDDGLDDLPSLWTKTLSFKPDSKEEQKEETPTNEQEPFSYSLDGKKGFYILNPSGDLRKTQSQFQPWTVRMEALGWRGIVGRPPTELELVDALSTKDIVVYFGHGGAEQYIRSHKIRSLKRCASLMLWGCSSGTLKDYGEFDRNGTPWNYMLAGCPSLVANLWDVTDKDIDRLSEHVLSTLQTNPQSGRRTTTSEAVGHAREMCKLKYLTGAAPVVYGVPIEFD